MPATIHGMPIHLGHWATTALLHQRETGPYNLRPRNKFTKESGSRSSRGEMQAQGGPVRSRGERFQKPRPYSQNRRFRQKAKHQGHQEPEQEPRNGRSIRQSQRRGRNSSQQERHEMKGRPA
ncbi:hypothetical protein TNIN_374551, partial [Trichonephila inaurata madagascariensis]